MPGIKDSHNDFDEEKIQLDKEAAERYKARAKARLDRYARHEDKQWANNLNNEDLIRLADSGYFGNRAAMKVTLFGRYDIVDRLYKLKDAQKDIKRIFATAADIKDEAVKAAEEKARKEAEEAERKQEEERRRIASSSSDNSSSGSSSSESGSESSYPSGGAMGNYGRLYIPDVGYSARLEYTYGGKASTDATEAWDMAFYSDYWTYSVGTWLLGDHNYQGFRAMRYSVPGSTKAYILRPDGTYEVYLCTSVFHAHKDHDIFTYDDGTGVWYNEGILMYTCDDVGAPYNIWVSHWTRVE